MKARTESDLKEPNAIILHKSPRTKGYGTSFVTDEDYIHLSKDVPDKISLGTPTVPVIAPYGLPLEEVLIGIRLSIDTSQQIQNAPSFINIALATAIATKKPVVFCYAAQNFGKLSQNKTLLYLQDKFDQKKPNDPQPITVTPLQSLLGLRLHFFFAGATVDALAESHTWKPEKLKLGVVGTSEDKGDEKICSRVMNEVIVEVFPQEIKFSPSPMPQEDQFITPLLKAGSQFWYTFEDETQVVIGCCELFAPETLDLLRSKLPEKDQSTIGLKELLAITTAAEAPALQTSVLLQIPHIKKLIITAEEAKREQERAAKDLQIKEFSAASELIFKFATSCFPEYRIGTNNIIDPFWYGHIELTYHGTSAYDGLRGRYIKDCSAEAKKYLSKFTSNLQAFYDLLLKKATPQDIDAFKVLLRKSEIQKFLPPGAVEQICQETKASEPQAEEKTPEPKPSPPATGYLVMGVILLGIAIGLLIAGLVVSGGFPAIAAALATAMPFIAKAALGLIIGTLTVLAFGGIFCFYKGKLFHFIMPTINTATNIKMQHQPISSLQKIGPEPTVASSGPTPPTQPSQTSALSASGSNVAQSSHSPSILKSR